MEANYKQADKTNKDKEKESKKWPGYCRTITVTDSHGAVKELVFPKALDLDRPKRERTTFSVDQLSRLEDEFQLNQYLVGKDRTALANNLGLSETQVKVWFQNRRTKHKKDKERRVEGSDSHAESQAAQNVLKLLEYKTAFGYSGAIGCNPNFTTSAGCASDTKTKASTHSSSSNPRAVSVCSTGETSNRYSNGKDYYTSAIDGQNSSNSPMQDDAHKVSYLNGKNNLKQQRPSSHNGCTTLISDADSTLGSYPQHVAYPLPCVSLPTFSSFPLSTRLTHTIPMLGTQGKLEDSTDDAFQTSQLQLNQPRFYAQPNDLYCRHKKVTSNFGLTAFSESSRNWDRQEEWSAHFQRGYLMPHSYIPNSHFVYPDHAPYFSSSTNLERNGANLQAHTYIASLESQKPS